MVLRSMPGSAVHARAGRVGSAFAAELGTMAVSEQTDSLRVLGSDPVDYLVTPRVLACMVAAPILNLMCFAMGAPPSWAARRAALPPQGIGHADWSHNLLWECAQQLHANS